MSGVLGSLSTRSPSMAPREASAPSATVDEAAVRGALAEVADPEIPVISIVDLGLVGRVTVPDRPDAAIEVDLLPTFVGCPALDMIRGAVEDRLAAFGRPATVRFVYDPPWTSDRISPAGRDALRSAGFAPPTGLAEAGDGARALPVISLDAPVPCPFCGARRTVLENAFGPTQCRTIRYCPSCRQPFEAFKEV